jgi:hypothetical protein
MTVSEWLATRTPAPPPQLMARVRAALGRGADDDARLVADRCLDAAERLVTELLWTGRTARDSAFDLLAADALVTYAFEAAATDPGGATDRARVAIVRLARLGAIQTAAPPQSDNASRSPGPT